MSDDKHRATAEAVLPLVGGAANIHSVAHCMTRLRLGLRDRSLVDEERLRALPAVLGVVEDDTYQIVLGPGVVSCVTPELRALLDGAPPDGALSGGRQDHGNPGAEPPVGAGELARRGAAIRARAGAGRATPVRLVLGRIANVFVPLIPALIGCGIVAAVNGALVNLGWAPALVPALTAISAGFMSLLTVFVGYNTAKEFGGTPVLGGAVASVIVYAGVSKVEVLGHQLVPGRGGVIGALAAALLAVQVERWTRRVMPDGLDVLLTPTVTVLVTGLVTLFGLMFVAGEVSSAIGDLATWLLAHGGALAGLLLGGLFLPLVMFGLHQALIPIHTTLIQQHGSTELLPILAMAGAGQVGCAVAVLLRLRGNTSVRATIRSALPAGLLGVGEPLIYGVSLPLGRPFVTACLGGACGGAVVGLLGQLGATVGATAIGPSGWALFPLLTGSRGFLVSAAVYAAGLATGYTTGLLATYYFGFTREMLDELGAVPPPHGPATGTGTPAAEAARDAPAVPKP
ncbi:PTS transporter subunit EIIC [Kitasatospora sp. NPDC048540]|uniref:PTS transporter subunit EIIC n=1 Tax=unclassified Kitasatospora TaxID=2633591 RepID=UPI0009E992BE|nr:PTS transporter subunit EIIC [Kitasatospora sp. MBT63]